MLSFILMLLIAALPQIVSGQFLLPDDLAQGLLSLPAAGSNSSSSSLMVLFTGDTQYHFPCAYFNAPCKERARNCTLAQQAQKLELSRNQSGNVKLATTTTSEAASTQTYTWDKNCIRVESEFANEVQRKCIYRLIRLLEERGQKPAALIINGDLTNFGHAFQLELFKNEWLRTMPVPLLLGLGNHDYENNVDDCMGNNCAERMLRWFSQEWAPGMDRQLVANMDLQTSKELWRSRHEGSLAYSSKLCVQQQGEGSSAGGDSLFCIHSLQLHNRPDYAATIQYPTGHWHIRGSFQWLLAQLDRIVAEEDGNGSSHGQIVLINLHNHGLKVGERLRGTLELWHRQNMPKSARLHFMVLFAHIHENHSMAIRCLNGRRVPHIFVGSVPNNRFTAIRFGQHGQLAEIFLLQANPNSTVQIVQTFEHRWSQC